MRKAWVLLILTSMALTVIIISGQPLQASIQYQVRDNEMVPAPAPAQPLRLGSTLHVESETSPLTPLSDIVLPGFEPQPPDLSEVEVLQPYLTSEETGRDDQEFEPMPEAGDTSEANQSCTNYIRNGSFETNSDWSASSSNVQYNSQFYYHGARSLFLTTQNRVNAWARQTVQLPAQMSSIFVRFKYAALLDTNESAWVQIHDANDNRLLTYGAIPAASGQWYERAFWLDQNILAGKRIYVYFTTFQDNDNYHSHMWLDSVELGVCNTPPPNPTDDTRTINFSISLYRTPTLAERQAYQNIVYYAADAIYEMSNGKHFLGTVTIYQNRANWQNSHVRWHGGSLRPNATISGYHHRARNSFINIADYWTPNGCGYMLDERNQKCAGYVLAHEFGHYFYGLLDEYKINPGDQAVEWSVMSNQHEALDDTDPYRFYWLNFSVPIITPEGDGWNYLNNQYYTYRASAWETLVRHPNYDPHTTFRLGYPERKYFPELVGVAPRQNQWPSHQLPGGSAQARSRVNFNWVSPATFASASEPAFHAQITSGSGNTVAYPQPVLLEASAAEKYLVARAGIQAHVISPDGRQTMIALKDDGVPPDEIADDGRYSGFMPYDRNGTYTVNVNFNNASGNAVFTYKGLADSPQQFGDLVGESFSASASTTITVNNYAADDHGNQFQSATTLPSDNLSKTGRVDHPGDLDMFKGTLLGNGLHVFRISNFAGGMQPRIRFWDASSGTLLGDFSFTPAPGYYYIFYITGDAGASFFAGISDSNTNAAAGMYDVSFGLPLTGELVSNDIYLPIAIRP